MQEQKKRILILYTSIGLGHKTIAENIGYWLLQDGYDVRLEDVLKVQSGKLVRVSSAVHRFITINMPAVWSFLYRSSIFTNMTLRFRTQIAARHHLQTLAIIQEYKPDLVVTTQTTASAVVAFLKLHGLYKGKFAIAFSDFHLHKYWLYEQADMYFVNISEQKHEMVRLGVTENKIFVCGIALQPSKAGNGESVKAKLGVEMGEKVVLVGSGSLGYGVDEEMLERLSQEKNIRVIVVCGKNHELWKRLSGIFGGTSVTVLSYYAPMDELYAISDVYIAKPGGLSVAEALRFRVPILISHMLPGQEELNYEYLLEKGFMLPEPINIVGEVLEELQTGSFRENLYRNQNISVLFPTPQVLQHAVQSVLQVTEQNK